MPFIDLHCDTVTELLDQNKSLADNNLCISVKKLKQAKVFCQFFAMYVKLAELGSPQAAFERIERMYKCFCAEMAANQTEILHVRSAQELENARSNGKIAAFLTVEEGGVCGSSIERLEKLYDMGVRLITLTWNYENTIGYPNSDDAKIMNSGLKPFGIEFVENMQRLGMIIDVSHLSDGGFWDVCKHAKKPFVASHSNARAVRNFRRNLTDEQLKALGEHGGVTGINFFHRFLGYDETGSISQMVEHILHIKNVAGIETLAIGSDFDGFGGPCEMHDATDLPKIIDALTAAGFSSEEIEKICWKNALRVIKDVL